MWQRRRRLRIVAWGLLGILVALPQGWSGEPGENRPAQQTVNSVQALRVQVAATGNVTISNPGTAVFDGITLPSPSGVTANYPDGTNQSARTVLLWQQTTQHENGIYLFKGSSTAMTRVSDFDASEEMRPGTPVHVLQGTIYARSVFYLTNTAYPTVGSTALTFAKPNVTTPPSAVQSLSASSQINCGANDVASRTVRIKSASAGNPVTLTSTPQILAGSDGQLCYIAGTDDTETVTITNGDGFNLGALANLTFEASTIHLFQYVLADSAWRLITSGSSSPGSSTDTIKDVFSRGNVIDNATSVYAWTIKDPASAAKKVEYWAGGLFEWDVLGADGQPMNRNRTIAAGKSDTITTADGQCERIEGTNSVHSYSNGCKPTKAIWFDAAALSPDGTNCQAPTEQVLNSGPKTWAFTCNDNAASVFYGKIGLLHSGYDGGVFNFTIHTFLSVTETITLAGDFSAQCKGATGETIDNVWGTAVAADVSITTTNQYHRATSGNVTPAGSCNPGDLLIFRYVIDAANTSTNAANTRILGVTVSFKAKTRSGANE